MLRRESISMHLTYQIALSIILIIKGNLYDCTIPKLYLFRFPMWGKEEPSKSYCEEKEPVRNQLRPLAHRWGVIATCFKITCDLFKCFGKMRRKTQQHTADINYQSLALLLFLLPFCDFRLACQYHIQACLEDWHFLDPDLVR